MIMMIVMMIMMIMMMIMMMMMMMMTIYDVVLKRRSIEYEYDEYDNIDDDDEYVYDDRSAQLFKLSSMTPSSSNFKQ